MHTLSPNNYITQTFPLTFIYPNYICMCLAGKSNKVFAKWGSSIFLWDLFPTMMQDSGGVADMTHVNNHHMEQRNISILQTSFSMHADKINWSYLLINRFKMFLKCECYSSEQKLETGIT